MRKNKMMRAASALLVAVLLTTSVISGTFAKYVTEASAEDSARVAKFGIVLQADGSLYGENYVPGAIDISVPTTTDNAALLSVKTAAVPADNVVAPGTKSDKGLNFSINGTSEVRTKLDVTITSENIYLKAGTYAVMVEAPNVTETSYVKDVYYYDPDTGDTISEYVLDTAAAFTPGRVYYTKENEVTTADYYPVVYRTDDKDTGNTTADSLDAIAAMYAAKLNSGAVVGTVGNGKTTYTITNKVYDPNKNYTELEVEDESLTWAWAFEGTGSEAEKQIIDGADTILGCLQADIPVVKWDALSDAYVPTTPATGTNVNDYNLETGFSIDITVTQVD